MTVQDKKIVLFYKRLIAPGGAERVLLQEFSEFKKAGYEPVIVTFELDERALFGKSISASDVIVLSAPVLMLSIIRLFLFVSKNKRATYLCASGHIEIYLATAFFNVPYALHIHQPSFMSFNEFDKYSYFLRQSFDELTRGNYGANRFRKIKGRLTLQEKFYINLRAVISIRAIRVASKIFVFSGFAQEEKKKLFGVISSVHFAAFESKVLTYIPKRNFLPRSNKGQLALLSVGRLDVNKRLDELLKAYKLYQNQNPNSILYIAGTGPEKSALMALAAELNIENKVVFLGFVPECDLLDCFASADIFVSIDWAEFTITTFEALAMGVPVVCSNERSFDSEVLATDFINQTIPDASHTSEAIIETLNRTYSHAQKERLKQLMYNYTWERYCEEILSELEGIA